MMIAKNDEGKWNMDFQTQVVTEGCGFPRRFAKKAQTTRFHHSWAPHIEGLYGIDSHPFLSRVAYSPCSWWDLCFVSYPLFQRAHLSPSSFTCSSHLVYDNIPQVTHLVPDHWQFIRIIGPTPRHLPCSDPSSLCALLFSSGPSY